MALSGITSLATTTIRAGWQAFNQLITDLTSTSTGKGASCVGVEDSAGNLDADNVEDAITEIYADTASTRTLAEAFSEDSSTTTGLTWGYKGGRVRNDNVIYTISDGTLSLTDDATNYVQITPSGTISRNTSGFTSGYCPIRQVVCASGAQTTSTDKRAWFQSVNVSIETVPDGGTGLSTITDHGILVGSGIDPITPLSVMTNGQLPIGSTGADPVPATLTGTANQITVTNAAGSITLSITTNPTLPGNTTLGGTLDLGGKLTGGAHEIEGSNFDINGGNIDNTTIGASTAAAGTFSSIDMGGNLITLDSDGDSKIGCDSDDVLTVDLNSTEVLNIGNTGVVTTAQNSAARAYRNGTQSIATGSVTVVQFNAESYDIRGEFDSSSNYEFVAGVAGIYLINAQIQFLNMNAGNTLELRITVGATNVAHVTQIALAGTNTLNAATIQQLSVSSDVDVRVQHNYGSARNINTGTSITFLEVIKLH